MKKHLYLCLVASLLCMGPAMHSQTHYDLQKMQREHLGRGTVALRINPDSVLVSWRYLTTDPGDVSFNVYRDGERLNAKPVVDVTEWYDANASKARAEYEIRAVVNGREAVEANGKATLPENAPTGYLEIPLCVPSPGRTPDGHVYSYSANDASIGDVDGDGAYEIVLKWEPNNARDNSSDGFTGNVLLDAYKMNGKHLWRIDLGRNIRAGAHYTQFMVYDLDGDGRAEVACKTADGTRDGTGAVIGDSTADFRVGVAEAQAWAKAHPEEANSQEPSGGMPPARFRPRGRRDISPPGDRGQRGTEAPEGRFFGTGGAPNRQDDSLHKARMNDDRMNRKPGSGRIVDGPEYLTVFDGATGRALKTTDYVPPRGDVRTWGDGYANRSDRFLACVAYLDGVYPSLVMCRGYYTRTVLAAFDWNGYDLRQRWVFDSYTAGNEAYAGQGNHNLRVADVDGDGCDEITYGACCIDNDGKGLYTTGMGHGDAMHLTAFFPCNDALQVWDCHENRRDGSELHDARTGKIIFQVKAAEDVGRCMAADIDPTNPGLEMWSLASGGLRNTKGKVINADPQGLSHNMAIWWDGDLLRELLDHERITKYDWSNGRFRTIQTFPDCTFNNSTKSNPCLQADIVGDWREEMLVRTRDNTALRLYVSPLPTKYRFHSFLEDPVYRISVATENVAYNQPTQVGFYFGTDLKKGTLFRGTLIK
jgi:rhamnogalacturonan endolyase